jgi:hypothetical protein
VINLPFPGDMDPDPPLPPRTTPGNLCLHVPYPGHGAKKGQNKLAKKIEKEKKRKKKNQISKVYLWRTRWCATAICITPGAPNRAP